MIDWEFVQSLEDFLQLNYPGLRLFRAHGSDKLEVVLPYWPEVKNVDREIDDAWERNR